MLKKFTLTTLIFISAASSFAADRQPAFWGSRRSERSQTTAAQGGLNVLKCKKCNVPFSDENWVQFESLSKCAPARRYLQEDLLKLPEVLRNPRESQEGLQFPVACIVHAQRTTTSRVRENPTDSEPSKWSGYEVPARGFAQCETSNGAPVRGNFMPCVTPEYSYSVYHAFNDVADCFGINGRKLLPKLWNESGLHITALGGGLDAGVGQLTKSALNEVLTPPFANDERTALEIFKASAQTSEKASCQRLLQYDGAFDVISTEASNRCNIITPTQNPVRNLVYMGIFYKLNERFVVDRVRKTGMQEKALQLGLTQPDMEYFNDVILTLSFNAGRGTAFAMVDSLLKARIAEGKRLSVRELDFLANPTEEIRTLRREPKDESSTDREKRLARLTQARDTAHYRNLPQYLRLIHGINADFETDPERKRISGAPGYLTFVADRQKKYDNELGESTCTQKSFLQHR